jgi:shikimate dehydrogenase
LVAGNAKPEGRRNVSFAGFDFLCSLNPGFLGDKIALGAIIAASASTGLKPLGVEWAIDELSFLDFTPPVEGTFLLARPKESPSKLRRSSLLQLIKILTPNRGVLAYQTKHTREVFSPTIYRELTRHLELRQLWLALTHLAATGIWPVLVPPAPSCLIAKSLIASLGLRQGRYFTLHTRMLKRNPERNLERQKYFKICHDFYLRQGIPTIWLGDKSSSTSYKRLKSARHMPDGVIDLDGRLESVFDVAALIQTSAGHIGGDTGLTHLAAAVGAFVITVERHSNEPNAGCGPFQPAELIRKLSQESSTLANIEVAMTDALAVTASHREARRSTTQLAEVSCRNQSPPAMRTKSSSMRSRNSHASSIFSSVSSGKTSERVIELYEKLFEELGLDASYIPFRTGALSVAIELFLSLNIPGFTVSHPFKSEILRYVDDTHKVVAAIGAANTVACENGRWVAYNTDWIGALKALDSIAGPDGLASHKGQKALILGSGGAARALTYALSHTGLTIHLMSRNKRAAREIARTMPICDIHDWNLPPSNEFAAVVNATSIQSEDEVGASNWRNLRFFPHTLCLDVVFGRQNSYFSKLAAANGAKLATGDKMLEMQAREQATIFCRVRELAGI